MEPLARGDGQGCLTNESSAKPAQLSNRWAAGPILSGDGGGGGGGSSSGGCRRSGLRAGGGGAICARGRWEELGRGPGGTRTTGTAWSLRNWSLRSCCWSPSRSEPEEEPPRPRAPREAPSPGPGSRLATRRRRRPGLVEGDPGDSAIEDPVRKEGERGGRRPAGSRAAQRSGRAGGGRVGVGGE